MGEIIEPLVIVEAAVVRATVSVEFEDDQQGKAITTPTEEEFVEVTPTRRILKNTNEANHMLNKNQNCRTLKF